MKKIKTHHNLWSAPKAVLREVSTVTNVCSRKKEPSQANVIQGTKKG